MRHNVYICKTLEARYGHPERLASPVLPVPVSTGPTDKIVDAHRTVITTHKTAWFAMFGKTTPDASVPQIDFDNQR